MLIYIRSIAFIADITRPADGGIQLYAGIYLGRTCPGDIHRGIFRQELIAMGMTRPRELQVHILGLPLQVDIAAAGHFRSQLGRIHFHFDIAGAGDMLVIGLSGEPS